jgi:cobalamin biosynthesis Mg chelatase CobN
MYYLEANTTRTKAINKCLTLSKERRIDVRPSSKITSSTHVTAKSSPSPPAHTTSSSKSTSAHTTHTSHITHTAAHSAHATHSTHVARARHARHTRHTTHITTREVGPAHPLVIETAAIVAAAHTASTHVSFVEVATVAIFFIFVGVRVCMVYWLGGILDIGRSTQASLDCSSYEDLSPSRVDFDQYVSRSSVLDFI